MNAQPSERDIAEASLRMWVGDRILEVADWPDTFEVWAPTIDNIIDTVRDFHAIWENQFGSVWVPDPAAPSRRLDNFQADIDNLNITGREADSSSGPAAPTAG